MWTEKFHKLVIREISAEQFRVFDLGWLPVPVGYEAPSPHPSTICRSNSAVLAVEKAQQLAMEVRKVISKRVKAELLGDWEWFTNLFDEIDMAKRQLRRAMAAAEQVLKRSEVPVSFLRDVSEYFARGF
jgi:hypothetical protein